VNIDFDEGYGDMMIQLNNHIRIGNVLNLNIDSQDFILKITGIH